MDLLISLKHLVHLYLTTSHHSSKLLIAAITSYRCGFWQPFLTGLTPVMGVESFPHPTVYGLW